MGEVRSLFSGPFRGPTCTWLTAPTRRVDVSRRGYWEFRLGGINLGSQRMCTEVCPGEG
jgi:hypothetical protein